MSELLPSFTSNPSNNPLHFSFSLEPSPFSIKSNQFIINHNIPENSNIISTINEKNQNININKNDNIPPLSLLNEENNFSENSFLENVIKNEKQQNDFQNNSLCSLKESENSNSNTQKINQNIFQSGRWTENEHQKFLEGILKYGNEWKRVQGIIKTRSSTQARSHAQKFFLRMKKSVTNPQIWYNQEMLLDYIINNHNIKLKDGKALTQDQKDKLLSVIRFNLKPEEFVVKKPKENKSKDSNNEDESNEEYEEKDNLGYKKEDFENFIEENKQQRKMTFCSKKRKNSSNSFMNLENKIFDIKKDTKHKLSMEITQPNINKLETINNINNNDNLDINFNKEENYKHDNGTNTENNINGMIFGNKEKCSNCGGCGICGGNGGGNYIINHNIINITNNYNNNIFNSNFNSQYFINNPNNNQFNQNYLLYNNNNDSINSDINNNNSFNHSSKLFYNNNNFYPNLFNNENNNCNSINGFFENENFFPKSRMDCENKDPFDLEFGNINQMNNNNNDTNVNINMMSHIEEHGDDEDEYVNYGNNNNNDITYDY